MTPTTIAVFLVTGLWATASSVAPQSTGVFPSDAEIRSILAQRIDAERRNVGIVVGMVSPRERRVIAHGTMGLDDTRPVTGETVFEIGSVTKIFTSLLLADMVQRGEAGLTDSVVEHLPPGTKVGASPGRAIALVDLATHTSGLPFWPSNVPATREGALSMAAYTPEQFYAYLGEFEIPSDVGVEWGYSNTGAGLLGLALAHRAGTSYEELLASRITGPLGMNSTAASASSDLESRFATGYDVTWQPAPRWQVPALAGAGSLLSTAEDLLTFLASMDAPRSRTSAALSTMLETRRAGPGLPQALGWLIVSTGPDDAGILIHDGATLGFSSGIAYDPRTQSGVVVLSNTASGVGDIARHILRPMIPLSAPPGDAPTKVEIQMDPALFNRYAGRYEPGPDMAFVVSREGDALMIQLPGIPKLRLRAESERDFFVAENTRITVSFELGPDGRAARLLLKSPSGNAPAARVEEPVR